MWEGVSNEVGNKIHKVKPLVSTYESVTLWQIYFGHFKKTQMKKSRQKYIKSLELLFVWEKPLIFLNDGGIGNSLHLGFLFCFKASTKRRNETKWNLSKINDLLSVMKRKHAPIAFTLVFPSLFYTLELDSLQWIKDELRRGVLLLRTRFLSMHFDSQLRHDFVPSISRWGIEYSAK